MTDDLLTSLRQWDRPRYLALLLMPEEKRADILALYAFNAELERIPQLVSEPQIGEVRFQWWIDTLEGIGKGAAQDHPVAHALARTITRHRLPIDSLRNMAEARTRLLYADVPENIEDLETYLGTTTSALIQQTALILDAAAAGTVASAAGYAGVAQGIAEILAEPHRFANLLPKGWTTEQLAHHGLKRLAEARSVNVPHHVFPAFLPAAAAQRQIDKTTVKLGPLRVQWLLWRASRRKKI